MNHRNGWASPNQLKPLREKTGVSGGRTPAPGRPGLRATAVALACPAGFGTSRRPVTRTGSLKHPPPPPPHSAPRGSNLLENLAYRALRAEQSLKCSWAILP